ncbi:hypothetical protein EsH8_XIII_000034 [Colletotrichum jinshuiense]
MPLFSKPPSCDVVATAGKHPGGTSDAPFRLTAPPKGFKNAKLNVRRVMRPQHAASRPEEEQQQHQRSEEEEKQGGGRRSSDLVTQTMPGAFVTPQQGQLATSRLSKTDITTTTATTNNIFNSDRSTTTNVNHYYGSRLREGCRPRGQATPALAPSPSSSGAATSSDPCDALDSNSSSSSRSGAGWPLAIAKYLFAMATSSYTIALALFYVAIFLIVSVLAACVSSVSSLVGRVVGIPASGAHRLCSALTYLFGLNLSPSAFLFSPGGGGSGPAAQQAAGRENPVATVPIASGFTPQAVSALQLQAPFYGAKAVCGTVEKLHADISLLRDQPGALLLPSFADDLLNTVLGPLAESQTDNIGLVVRELAELNDGWRQEMAEQSAYEAQGAASLIEEMATVGGGDSSSDKTVKESGVGSLIWSRVPRSWRPLPLRLVVARRCVVSYRALLSTALAHRDSMMRRMEAWPRNEDLWRARQRICLVNDMVTTKRKEMLFDGVYSDNKVPATADDLVKDGGLTEPENTDTSSRVLERVESASNLVCQLASGMPQQKKRHADAMAEERRWLHRELATSEGWLNQIDQQDLDPRQTMRSIARGVGRWEGLKAAYLREGGRREP